MVAIIPVQHENRDTAAHEAIGDRGADEAASDDDYVRIHKFFLLSGGRL
jgi:hypothetical protein